MAIFNTTTGLVNPSTGPTWDTWVGRTLPANPSGSLLAFPGDKVYAAIGGVFGVGGSVKLSFSDNNSTFTDHAAYTAAVALVQLSTSVPHRYWRAQVTAGDGTTAIDVSLLATREITP